MTCLKPVPGLIKVRAGSVSQQTVGMLPIISFFPVSCEPTDCSQTLKYFDCQEFIPESIVGAFRITDYPVGSRPLSLHMQCGTPLEENRSARASITSPLRMCRSTFNARHPRAVPRSDFQLLMSSPGNARSEVCFTEGIRTQSSPR